MYSPFGEMWVEEASTVDISNITRFFTNQQYDKESGLYYYNARYYDPHLGSFITPDPAMDNQNHYAYCSANPIKYTDPTGLLDENGDPNCPEDYESIPDLDSYFDDDETTPTNDPTNNNSDNSYLFTTNGTIFPKISPKTTPENYFVDSKGKRDSKSFTNDVANKLGINNSQFLKWSGANEKEVRDQTIKEFVDKILKTEGLNKESAITLLGHSHGGNIMIEVADKLSALGYNVNTVYSLEAPVRSSYQPDGDYKVEHTFSPKDWVQNVGVWDTDTNKNKVIKEGKVELPVGGHHTFKSELTNVTNINITSFYNNYFNNTPNRNVPSGLCPMHQSVRDFNFLNTFLF